MPAPGILIHFAQWLESQHPEQETLKDLSEEELMCLINEFESKKGNHMRLPSSNSYRDESRKKALWVAYTNRLEPPLLSFENWLDEKNIQNCILNVQECSLLVSRYLYYTRNKSLYLYTRSRNVLYHSKDFYDYIETLKARGIQFDLSDIAYDFLEEYKSFPLRATFLYTSEDSGILEYIAQHYTALDELSGDFCLVFAILDIHRNRESAYSFIEGFNMLTESNFSTYSQLPGIFFWDKSKASAFISFGPKPSPEDITLVLRTVFNEVRKNNSLFSVYRARKLLNEKNFSESLSEDVALPGEPFHIILKRERELYGWSQEDLASKLNCDLKTVSRWENGKALPQSFYRQTLSKLFNKDLLALGLVQDSDNLSTS